MNMKYVSMFGFIKFSLCSNFWIYNNLSELLDMACPPIPKVSVLHKEGYIQYINVYLLYPKNSPLWKKCSASIKCTSCAQKTFLLGRTSSLVYY